MLSIVIYRNHIIFNIIYYSYLLFFIDGIIIDVLYSKLPHIDTY